MSRELYEQMLSVGKVGNVIFLIFFLVDQGVHYALLGGFQSPAEVINYDGIQPLVKQHNMFELKMKFWRTFSVADFWNFYENFGSLQQRSILFNQLHSSHHFLDTAENELPSVISMIFGDFE